MYYTYMLRCEDNSIYTGIASNLERRMEEHFERNGKEAKYTRSRKAKCLEVAWQSENKSTASKLEYWIKKLNKENKENLIKDPNLLRDMLKEKIEPEKYHKVEAKNKYITANFS